MGGMTSWEIWDFMSCTMFCLSCFMSCFISCPKKRQGQQMEEQYRTLGCSDWCSLEPGKNSFFTVVKMASLASPLPSSVAKNKGTWFLSQWEWRGEARHLSRWPKVRSPVWSFRWATPHPTWYGKWAALGWILVPVNLGAVGNLKPYIFP